MYRRVQPILILALTMTLCLGALPPQGERNSAAAHAAPPLAQQLPAPERAPSGPGNNGQSRAGKLLAEFDMPFFSFAGITRPRL
jgi:hypothetical protein